MNFIAWIVVGAIGGWIASKIVKSDRGIIGNIIAGIVGGLVVGWIVALLTGKDIMTGIDLVSIIAAIIGAIIVGAIWSMITGRGKSAASEMTSSASNMAKSAANTASNAASSAANTASSAASSAANTASSAASGAANLTTDATAGMAGAAAGAAAGAMGAMNMDQMGGMLSGILGGNMKLDANSPLGQMVMPMADGITAKLGLPKEVGQMVVVFALAKLTEMMQSKSSGKPMTKSDGSPMTGINTDEVLGKLNSGGGIDVGQLQSMGLTKDLAAKTGISEDQATQGLQMAFGELSAGLSGAKSYEGTALPDMSMLTGMIKK